KKHDDDEDPPAEPNHGKKIKRRRTKDSESSKKPSTTKETSKGKSPSKGFKIGKSAIEELIAEVVMDDAGDDVGHDDDQPQDTSEPKTTKTSNLDWFTQPLRPPTPDLEWNKRQVVLDQPEQPWVNQMVFATKDPLKFDDLMATPIDFSKYLLNRLKIDNLTQDILLGPAYNLLKGTCFSSIKLEYHFQECFNALTNRLDWNNPEGDSYSFDLSKPSRSRRPKQLSMRLKGLKTWFLRFGVLPKSERTIEGMLLLAVQHKLFHLTDDDIIEFIVASSYTVPEIEFKEPYPPSHKPPGVIYEDLVKQKRVMQADELYKFSDGMLMKVRDEFHHRVLDFDLGYNKENEKAESWIIRNLERLVGARELEMDYKLMTHTV
ncbi:hypothetical protein Tco_1257179, partial [Tanacetum coccineum]